MPWTRERGRGSRRAKRPVWPARGLVLFSAILLGAILSSGAAPEKHLSVYSVAANYSLPLVQREGRDYVGLLELLEPLGNVTSKTEGSRWRLRYNSRVEGIFQIGRTRARVQDREADLGGRFLLENRRGLVPVSSLASLLPRFLGGPVTLHEESDRLFIGSVATHFTASLSGDNPPRLVLHFSAPVNPTVATEPGALRLTFSREPVVAPASPTLTFGSKAMPSANYSENNGSAVLTVNATIPVMATFGNDGRIITVTATSVAAQNAPPFGPASSPTPQAPAAPSTPAATPAAPAPRRYFAVVDGSHGGDDHGETLSPTLLEKERHRRFGPQPAPGTRKPRHQHSGSARLRREPFGRPARGLRQCRSRSHLHRIARGVQRAWRAGLHCAAALRGR